MSIAITALTPFSVFHLLNRILQTIAKKIHQNWRHSVAFIANFEQINARWVKE